MVQTLEKYSSHRMRAEFIEAHKALQVMIVDTHTLMREALHRVVDALPGIRVCASLATFHELPPVIPAQVIVIGSSLQISESLDFVEVLHKKQDPVGVVVIQHCLSPETTLTLVKSGVHGLLGENASQDDLARAIIAAATKGSFLDHCAREMLHTSVSRAAIHFTRREVEVLSLLKSGETNFRIAHALGMKEKTVEKHLSHIYEKLHISSRVEAILHIQRLRI